MNLLLVVYFVNLLVSANNFLGGIIVVLIVIAIITGGVFVGCMSDLSEKGIAYFKQKAYKYTLWPKTIIFSIFICWVIPDEKTIQYMAGAYIIEQTYSSDFVAACTATEQIVDLDTMLWYLGVNLQGGTYMFRDNKSVMDSSMNIVSKLHKQHNIPSYHQVCEIIESGMIHFIYITGSCSKHCFLGRQCNEHDLSMSAIGLQE